MVSSLGEEVEIEGACVVAPRIGRGIGGGIAVHEGQRTGAAECVVNGGVIGGQVAARPNDRRSTVAGRHRVCGIDVRGREGAVPVTAVVPLTASVTDSVTSVTVMTGTSFTAVTVTVKEPLVVVVSVAVPEDRIAVSVAVAVTFSVKLPL